MNEIDERAFAVYVVSEAHKRQTSQKCPYFDSCLVCESGMGGNVQGTVVMWHARRVATHIIVDYDTRRGVADTLSDLTRAYYL
jgi:hypothetical protein